MEGQTVGDFLSRFDNYSRSETSVLIHPGFTSFLEVSPEFLEKLKNELQMKLLLISKGIEEMDSITQFCIWILEDSF